MITNNLKTLIVDLGDRSYPIYFGSDLSEGLRETLAKLKKENRSVAVVIDDHLSQVQQAFVERAFSDVPMLVLPSGETTKCFTQLERICEFMASERIDRSGVLFAVGGGVTGDLGGFSASSFLRGIDYYQVPTTLLAMVDSSVGGKTGINIKSGKNLVGAFWQPRTVFISTSLLKTLPAREFSAGMAEVIKYGMLYDINLFDRLESMDALHPDHPELMSVIHRCCEIKAEVVKADEKEIAGMGGRALLNLGHTFAHAIEAVAGYGTYLHGEAVAIGLVLASQLSERLGYLNRQDTDRVRALCEKYDLPVTLREPLSGNALVQAMTRDKKVKQGTIKFVVMEALGSAVTSKDVDMSWMNALWNGVGAI